MKKTFNLWKKEEYQYLCAGEFVPNLTAYLHEDHTIRPAVVIVPGGGYSMVSPQEGEPVAERFAKKGYQAFVLTYTTNMFQTALLEKQPLKEISRAVRFIRKNAGELYVDGNKIACCGFSAGGHLAGSLAVHYDDPSLKDEPEQEISNRPDAVLLCYPVISGGDPANRGYMELLFGKEGLEKQMEWASLEKNVTPDTPPAFLWHAMDDSVVSPENSIQYMQACRIVNVPCELHLFAGGGHGMSLADAQWASDQIDDGSLYTMMQQWQTIKILFSQNQTAFPEGLADAAKADSLSGFVKAWNQFMSGLYSVQKKRADESISQWVALAIAWLDKIYRTDTKI